MVGTRAMVLLPLTRIDLDHERIRALSTITSVCFAMAMEALHLLLPDILIDSSSESIKKNFAIIFLTILRFT